MNLNRFAMKVFALFFFSLKWIFISVSVHFMEAFLEFIAISLKVKVYGDFGFGVGTSFGEIG